MGNIHNLEIINQTWMGFRGVNETGENATKFLVFLGRGFTVFIKVSNRLITTKVIITTLYIFQYRKGRFMDHQQIFLRFYLVSGAAWVTTQLSPPHWPCALNSMQSFHKYLLSPYYVPVTLLDLLVYTGEEDSHYEWMLTKVNVRLLGSIR